MRQVFTIFIGVILCVTGKTQIVINELGIAPPEGSLEFIELYNRNSCPIDLSCYTLVFSGTSGAENPTGWTIKIPSGKYISACGYFLISGIAGSAGITEGTGFPTGGVVTPNPSADLNIGTASITGNAVYMKQGVNAGTLPNSSGQITLLNRAGIVVSSLSYNNGNNPGSYPLSAYTNCSPSGNNQGRNNIMNPGASPNNVNAVFSSTGNQGICLEASGRYNVSTVISPGLPNPSQIHCTPAITMAQNATAVCYSSNDQTTLLNYSSTTNSPTNYSIAWDAYPANHFINATNAPLPQGAITIPIPGHTLPAIYTGTITVSNASGTSCGYPFSLRVNATPTVDAGSYPAICASSRPLILTGHPSGGTFTGTYISGNSFIPPLTSGNYSVNYIYKDTSTNCTDSASTIIKVNRLPSVQISGDTIICLGQSVTLNASAANASIQWLGMAQCNSLIVNPKSTTVYTALATTADGCTDTATIKITVDDFTLQLFANPNPVVPGRSIYLQTSANSLYRVLWWFPGNLFPSHSAFTQQFITDTAVNVLVTAKSIRGCVDSATATIRIDSMSSEIGIPSAFTPNNDGKNDTFRVLGGNIKTFSLTIFNRWGEIIFSTRSRSKGWDGNFNGSPQLTGVYVYILKLVLNSGKVINKKGSIILIR